MTADPVSLDKLIRWIAADEVRELADDFGDGTAATVEGSFAAVRKGDPTAQPTPGFYIPPHLEVQAGDHVYFHDSGGFKLVLSVLNRNALAQPVMNRVYFDVRDFKAAVDGVTDDTNAVTDAMLACAAAGGGVVFVPGVCLVGQLAVPDGVTIEGWGESIPKFPVSGFKLKAGTNASLLFVHKRAQAVALRYLHLDGNKAENTGTSHVIEFEEGDGQLGSDKHISWATMTDLVIQNAVTDGINVGWSHATVSLERCFVQLCGRDGFRLKGDTSWVSKCNLSQNVRYGGLVEGPASHIVSSDFFGNDIGLYMDNQSGNGPWGGLVANCSFDRNFREAAFIAAGSRYTSWANCQFNANSYTNAGLYAHVYVGDVGHSFVGCSFYDDEHPPGSYTVAYDFSIPFGITVNAHGNTHAGHYTTAVTNTPSSLRSMMAGGAYFTEGGALFLGAGGLRFGASASSMYSGSGAPAAGLGVNGDFYFRFDTPGTVNQRLYVKAAGAWAGIL